MVYIPPGALVAGSAPNSLPRRPDRELPGEQVMLKGFFIDQFPFPNEEGAIPLTGATQPEAQIYCAKAGKRLCTELEWERACKGPSNHRYSWGDKYRAEPCQLGSVILARPSGMKVGCHSDFDVFDLHGGILEWTQSRWRRGPTNGAFVLKGGNGVDGELLGRCANAENAHETQRSPDIGFRCCAGPANAIEVILQGRSGDAIERVDRIDTAQFRRLLENVVLPRNEQLPGAELVPERAYTWQPVGNERLQVFVACTKSASLRRCGVLVGRDTPAQPVALGYADTGMLASALHMDNRTEDVWLLGLDELGNFKRLVRYRAGSIEVFPKERKVPRVKKSPSKGRNTSRSPSSRRPNNVDNAPSSL
jgi:hypothetical protein